MTGRKKNIGTDKVLILSDITSAGKEYLGEADAGGLFWRIVLQRTLSWKRRLRMTCGFAVRLLPMQIQRHSPGQSLHRR